MLVVNAPGENELRRGQPMAAETQRRNVRIAEKALAARVVSASAWQQSGDRESTCDARPKRPSSHY